MISLILGGARSGKSRFAEQKIRQQALDYQAKYRAKYQANNQSPQLNPQLSFSYIATATAQDDEMAKRIAHHQNDRSRQDISWQLIEQPIELGNSLQRIINAQQLKTSSRPNKHYVLIDCLTLWLSNCLCFQENNLSCASNVDLFQQQKASLLSALQALADNPEIELVIVSNEVGHGIVPLGQLSREFVDQSGWLHQEIAQLAQQVEFIIAGLATSLKNERELAYSNH